MACTPAQGPSISYPQGELVYPEPQFNTPITFIAPDPDTKTRATYQFVPSGHTAEHRALEQRALAPDKSSIDQDILHIRLDHLKEDHTALSAPPSNKPKVLRVSLVLEHNLSLNYLIQSPPRGDCINSPLSSGSSTGSSIKWHSAQKDSPYKLTLQCCDLKCTHAQGGVKKEDDTLFYFSHNTSYPEAQFETIPKGQKTKTSFFSGQKIKSQKQSFTVAHGVSRSVVELQSHPHLMQVSFNNLNLGAHAAPAEVNFRKWDGTSWNHKGGTLGTLPGDNQVSGHQSHSGNVYIISRIVENSPPELHGPGVTQVSDYIKWSIISKSLTVPIAHPVPTKTQQKDLLKTIWDQLRCSAKKPTKCYPDSMLNLSTSNKTAQNHINKQLNALAPNEGFYRVQENVKKLKTTKKTKTKNYFTNLYALRPLVQHFFTNQGIVPSAVHVLYRESEYVNKNFPNITNIVGDDGESKGVFQIWDPTYKSLKDKYLKNFTTELPLRHYLDSSFLLSMLHFKTLAHNEKKNLEFLLVSHNTGPYKKVFNNEDTPEYTYQNQKRHTVFGFPAVVDGGMLLESQIDYALDTMALHFMGLRPECYLEDLIDSSKTPAQISFKVTPTQADTLKNHMYPGSVENAPEALKNWHAILKNRPDFLKNQTPLTIKAECKYKPER